MNRPYVLGVDPGVSGALAVIDGRSLEIKSLIDMPLSTKAENGGGGVDGYTLSVWLAPFAEKIQLAVIELVGGMTYISKDADGRQFKRGQGSAASFAFGKSAGVVQGAIQGLLIPCHFPSAGVWKSLMGLTSNKSVSRERARRQWPTYSKSFDRVKDDGRAEAALLALFGAQRFFK